MDSLLTGLPVFVKPAACFSKTTTYIASFYTNNKLPSSPAAIYLPFNPCHLSFLAIVFSCLLAWPLLSLERCVWISGSLLLFFIFFLDQSYNWPMKLSLKFHRVSLTSCATSKTAHYRGGQSSTESHCNSSIISARLLPPVFGGAALLEEENSERWVVGCRDSFSSSVCVHHVSWPLLAFMFCLAESPAPAVSVSLLKIGVPQRQETLPPLHPFQLRSA